jgi:nucleoid-associated protein YgaU
VEAVRRESLPESVLAEAPPKPAAQASYHRVVKGDTLWGICRRTYGDGALAWKLAEANGIKNANLIFPGQVVKLPDKGSL